MEKENTFKIPKEGPLADMEAKKTDPQGSWTGVPADRDEVPVQDADDL